MDVNGNSPIHLVCKHLDFNKDDFHKFFDYHKGFNIDLAKLQNNEGQTPLHLATVEGKLDYVETMRNKKEPVKVNGQENKAGDSKALKRKKKQDDKEYKEAEQAFRTLVKVADRENITALHLAAEYKHVEIVKILLAYSENHKPGNNYGRTPLHIAAEFGALDCMESIIQNVEVRNKGLGIKKLINIDGKDLQGNTPLA